MELNEAVSMQLKQRKISKRDFAKKLIQREIRSKRTGEVLSEKIVYSYLDETTAMRAELIPHIAQILEITEQELFDDSEAKRVKQLRHILKNPTELEKKTAMLLLKELDGGVDYGFPTDYQLRLIAELLPYAPTITIDKILKVLAKYKELFEEVKE